MADSHSPTVRARVLGRELREIRKHLDLTQAAVGAQLGWSYQKVRRIEEALTRPEIDDLKALLDVYGIDRGSRLVLLELAENSWRRTGWWHGAFGEEYFALEDEASEIRDWETQFVSGLLQTPEYARAIAEAALPRAGDHEINKRVQGRMTRKELLSRDKPAQLHVVLDEVVLRRPIGGRDVMHGQLNDLLLSARKPNVTIQVLRMSRGAHVGLEGSFAVLSFAMEAASDIAYAEGPFGDAYLEGAAEVADCNLRFERLCDQALDQERSEILIADIAKE